MGIKTITTHLVTCDCCNNEIAAPYRRRERVLWSDRDVTATVAVSVSVVIPYSSQPNVICTPCAIKHMRYEADRLTAEQNKD